MQFTPHNLEEVLHIFAVVAPSNLFHAFINYLSIIAYSRWCVKAKISLKNY